MVATLSGGNSSGVLVRAQPHRRSTHRQALALALLAGIALGRTAHANPLPRFQAQYADPEALDLAWSRARPLATGHAFVSGLSVPHHLVAADLIATGFRTAAESGEKPSRIVVLVPDHFKRAGRPFATTRRGFDTAFGPVDTDHQVVEALLRSRVVENSDLFAREHGIGAVLPFVRRAFPGVPVVAIAIALRSKRSDWETMAGLLRPWVSARTLVVQSTDFSHYLSRGEAVAHDQQTLNVLASGDLGEVARLRQPQHLDSGGAQYLQIALQQRHFGAAPLVLANANSYDYGATGDDETTSYILQVYSKRLAERVIHSSIEGVRSMCFAGDTFFGRHVQAWMARPAVRARVLSAWRERLNGCPLVVNLEGVLAPTGSTGEPSRGPPLLRMPSELTLSMLRELNVVAVGLANNHSLDLGEAAYAHMVADLRGAGLAPLEHGLAQDVAGLRIVALRDLDNPPRARGPLVNEAEFAAVRQAAGAETALLVLLHWGQEYRAAPGVRESALIERLYESGARWIVGAHPHRASDRLQPLHGGRGLLAYSLGNFAFDQHAPRASGAVLQLSCFSQGTCAARWIPMPGIFELGLAPVESSAQR